MRDVSDAVSQMSGFNFKCDSCGTNLDEPGAVAFSPPNHSIIKIDTSTVRKFHICVKCFFEKFDPLLRALF